MLSTVHLLGVVAIMCHVCNTKNLFIPTSVGGIDVVIIEFKFELIEK